MTQEEKEKIVNKVLNDFDFGMVEQTMKMFDWGWAGCGDEITPPSTNVLRDEAERMLYEVLNGDAAFNAILCGGLAAWWNGEILQLDFILTTSEYRYDKERDENKH